MLQLEVSTDWLKLYILHNTEEEILNFIKREPMVAFVLLNAPRLLETTFPGSPLTLEIGHDPEIETRAEYLILTVQTELDTKEAIKRERQFTEEHWNSLTYFVSNRIMLDVE